MIALSKSGRSACGAIVHWLHKLGRKVGFANIIN